MSRTRWTAAALLAALPLALPAQSIRSLSQSSAIRKLWRPVVTAANRSVVEVCVDERAMGLGTVVAPDLVVTKLSEASPRDEEEGVLSIDQGTESWPCVQIGFDRPSDLALLRVKGAQLTPVEWRSGTPAPAAGGLVAAAVATFLAVRGSPARLLALPLVALAGIVASSTGGIVVDRKPKAA